MDEQTAIAIFMGAFPALIFCSTPKNEPADVDGMLVHAKSGEIMAIVETKCRYDITHDQFLHNYENQWLVTKDKLDRGARLARALRVPLLGWLYLVDDAALLWIKLTDRLGQIIPAVESRTTTTQKTCNGGTASRENSFIDMAGANILK
jgi:hypothetical protein